MRDRPGFRKSAEVKRKRLITVSREDHREVGPVLLIAVILMGENYADRAAAVKMSAECHPVRGLELDRSTRG